MDSKKISIIGSMCILASAGLSFLFPHEDVDVLQALLVGFAVGWLGLYLIIRSKLQS